MVFCAKSSSVVDVVRLIRATSYFQVKYSAYARWALRHRVLSVSLWLDQNSD